MSDVQDYASSLSDTSSRKFETFSYLPAMTPEQIRKQVEYLVPKAGIQPLNIQSQSMRLPTSGICGSCLCLVKLMWT